MFTILSHHVLLQETEFILTLVAFVIDVFQRVIKQLFCNIKLNKQLTVYTYLMNSQHVVHKSLNLGLLFICFTSVFVALKGHVFCYLFIFIDVSVVWRP